MINAAFEGESDREAVCALIRYAGREPGMLRPAGGATKLDQKIPGYRRAAQRMSWLVLRDSDGECPVALVNLLHPAHTTDRYRFSLRIVHSMTEAWLLGDRQGFAQFFGIRVGKIPEEPESLPHAKRTLLELCEAWASRSMRQDMVAKDGGAGPLYVQRVNEFAREHWSVERAAESSPSLARAIRAVRALR